MINCARGCKLRCTNYFVFNINCHSLHTCSRSLISLTRKCDDFDVIKKLFFKKSRANSLDNILITSFLQWQKPHTERRKKAIGEDLLFNQQLHILRTTLLACHFVICDSTHIFLTCLKFVLEFLNLFAKFIRWVYFLAWNYHKKKRKPRRNLNEFVKVRGGQAIDKNALFIYLYVKYMRGFF